MPMLSMCVVLAGLFGAMTSDGLATHNSIVRLSVPGGSVHWPPEQWSVTSTVLSTPGSGLSGPDTEPVSAMSGLSHQAPLVLCVPPSPELASMNVQVSPTSAGSDAMSPLRFHSFRVEQAITILQIVDAPARLSY